MHFSNRLISVVNFNQQNTRKKEIREGVKSGEQSTRMCMKCLESLKTLTVLRGVEAFVVSDFGQDYPGGLQSGMNVACCKTSAALKYGVLEKLHRDTKSWKVCFVCRATGLDKQPPDSSKAPYLA